MDRWLVGAERVSSWLGEFQRYQSGGWKVLELQAARREVDQVLRAAMPEGVVRVLPTAQAVEQYSAEISVR